MTRHHMTANGPIPFTADEEAERDAEEAAWAAGENDRRAEQVRAERDTKLAASDWTQMPDYNGANKVVWATYRQALRDIPAQAGFPWDVTWPEMPE
jgi:type II secretory pathway component PulL